MTTPLSVTLPHDGWQPRADQMPMWQALLNPAITTVVEVAHRRWGKDELALHWSGVHAHQRTGTIWHALPQYGQCRKAIWEAINPRTGRRRIFDAFPDPLIEHIDEQSMRVRFKCGSAYQLVGSDQTDSLVGTNPIAIVYSEAAMADPRAFGLFKPILAENRGKQIFISTPRGRNTFYDLYNAYRGRDDAFTQILPATDTNVFSAEQLAAERRDYIALYGDALGASMFEQEFMCSFEAAIVGAVWGAELSALKEAGRIDNLLYDSRFPVDTSWDFGVGDPTVILFWQNVGNAVRLIDYYQSTDSDLAHYASILAGKPYYYGRHITPHDTSHRGKWDATSGLAIGASLGLRFEPMPNTALHQQIAAASQLLKRTAIHSPSIVNGVLRDPMQATDPTKQQDCSPMLDAFEAYRFKYDETRRVMSSAPHHDWSSHASSAFCTYALYQQGTTMGHSRSPALQGRFDAPPPRLGAIMAAQSRKRPSGAFG